MNNEFNPYEASSVDPGANVEPRKRDFRKWHLAAILLIPMLGANAVFWGLALIGSKIFAFDALFAALFATPIVGFIYGAGLGSYLFFSQQFRHWFYFPLTMGIFQAIWFFFCLMGGCVLVVFAAAAGTFT